MSFRYRSVATVLFVFVMSLVATLVAASSAGAGNAPGVHRHMVQLPVDGAWHTAKFTMKSTVPSNIASKDDCTPTTNVRFSFRLRGRAKGYDIAFFKMTNQGTFTLAAGRLNSSNYRWLPTASLKVNETEKVYNLIGRAYSAGSQPWGNALIVTASQNGRSIYCAHEFIIGVKK